MTEANKVNQQADNSEVKPAVMVFCTKCKPDCEVTMHDFGKFDVCQCPHVNVLKRMFNPTWKPVSLVKEGKKK